MDASKILRVAAASLSLLAVVGAAPAVLADQVTAASGGQVSTTSPHDLIKTAAATLLQNLQAHRDDYRKDPSKLRMLIDQVILPNFDSQFAAQEVLGRSWRAATAQQRQSFINAFYNSMLNNYGTALLDFTSNTMEVLPDRGPATGQYAVVDTRIRRSNGSDVAVNYQLHQTPAGWKVWDVVVEGISYDKSFQQDFSEQIQRQGLDAVISHLQSGETPAAIKQTTGSYMDAFAPIDDGYRLHVPLQFASVPHVRPQGLSLIEAAGPQLCFDLSGVTAADSAGLALLIDWLANARARGKQLRYERLPAALVALAQLSDVAPLLEGQQTAGKLP